MWQWTLVTTCIRHSACLFMALICGIVKARCERFDTAWRKCIRTLLSLPYQTHSNLLRLICNDLPVHAQLEIRWIKFVESCLTSKNPCVRMYCKLTLDGSKSSLCNAYIHICYKLDACGNEDLFQIETIKYQLKKWGHMFFSMFK